MLRNFKNLAGSTLTASNGEIGKVRELYFDDEHWKVRYFVVTTGSWLFGREILLPPSVVEGIDEIHRTLAVHLTQEEVRHSPPVESDKPVSRLYEESMHKYYGWDPYWSLSGAGGGFGTPLVFGAIPPITGEIASAPPVTTHLRSTGEITGYPIHATDGELGKVEDVILDDRDWNIRYLVVRPGSWPSQTHILLSPEWIERLSYEEAEVVVNLPADLIRHAPPYESDQPITREYEDQLHAHYDRQKYWIPRVHP